MESETGESTSPKAFPDEAQRSGTDRSVAWILVGLVVMGIVFFYEWGRKLPK